MSPERGQQISRAERILEAGQNQSKGMAKIQEKYWVILLHIKVHVWIPLFYTIAF